MRRPHRFSQCAKILAVLEDGQPHTVSEIHARAGYSRLNSRVSELRKYGYTITCERVPGATGTDAYVYTLSGDEPRDEYGAHGAPPLPVPAARLTAVERAASSPGTTSGGVLPHDPLAPPLQLSLEAA